jgi:long-chain acyl-CoA synthetase
MPAKQVPLARGTGRAVTWLARQVEVVLSELDLSLAQYRLLALLEERPEVASALADKLTVSRPSVTTVVDGLVARGLVERDHDTNDRRRVNHALTEDGRKLLHHADEIVESGLEGVLSHLDPSGARDIAAGLGSLGKSVTGWVAAWQPSDDD